MSLNRRSCISYSVSVRLFVTRRYCVKTNEHWMMPSLLAGSTMFLVYGSIRLMNVFAGRHP